MIVCCAVLLFAVLAVVAAAAAAAGVSREDVLKVYPTMDPDQIDDFLTVLAKEVEHRQSNPQEFADQKFAIPKWNCPAFSPSEQIPTSVHRLLPGDIKVVAALGDSLTAAFGAKAGSILSIFTEYRGVSWSIGGDSSLDNDVVTLSNIMRKYNPNIIGFSTGTGKADTTNAHFNQAVTGAVSQDLVSQVHNLISRMNSTKSGVNYEKDWKMLTIWIGPNNLCDVCKEPAANTPEVYGAEIEAALDLLKARMPRLFVNIVPTLDVTMLYPLKNGFCGLLHSFECSCGANSDAKVREQVSAVAKLYQSKVFNLAQQAKYSDKDDFTVVIQPWTLETKIPTKPDGTLDSSYFAPDCFHFAGKSHANAALALWNNIIEPVNTKKTQWWLDEPFECAEKGEFLYTYKNSH